MPSTTDPYDELDTIKAVDCLILLENVSTARPEPQSLRGLGDKTNIPLSSLQDIINEAMEPGDSLLDMMATKYGYSFKINKSWKDHNPHREKWIIHAVKVGLDNPERWGQF